MKIIQTFAIFDEVSPYLTNKRNFEYVYLNFYSFILSYITIKKIYGPITMICNQEAYDAFIKYIPYDEIIIKKNENDFKMWAKYKLDSIGLFNEDLIHVDSDVIIFDDHFKPFIGDDYDIMVQNILPRKMNFVRDFGYNQKEFLENTKILTKSFDGKCFSCGVLGLKKNVLKYYLKGVDVLHEEMNKIGVEKFNCATMILEEQLLYFIAQENNFKFYGIIPESEISHNDDIIKYGDKIGYVHLWFGLKFKRDVIQMIRNKLFYDYPEYLNYVIKYEKEIMSNKKIFEYVVLSNS